MAGTLPRGSQSGVNVVVTGVAVTTATVIGLAVTGLAASLGGGAALARDCAVLLPRADGVLRLDTGDAVAVPCGGPRSSYAALPPRAASPPSRPAAPTPSQPQSVAPSVSLDAATADSLRQLQDETTRLKSELSRLTDETTRLRGETARLSEELARREPATTATAPSAPSPKAEAPAGEDASAAAEHEFERQKSVVERAWSQLVDMATRMKRDLGRP